MESMQHLLAQLGITQILESGGIVEYRLEANGLKVLLVEDHKSPVVLVDIVYRIGSRNEANGYTGSAHFFEHLMFKGTNERHPKDGRGIDDLLKPTGAYYNANTWWDRTQYFELLPARHLELALTIEFDRMRNLLVTREDRNAEMTVVRSEFEIGKNNPEQALEELGWAQAFTQHAYHWNTIGYLDDVENVPLESMIEFYNTYYHPNNATCIIIGDFKPQEALTLVAKYAGHIPPSPQPIPEVYTSEPEQSGERRFELVKPGSLPALWIGHHIPAATHKDIYALAAVAILLGGSSRRSSRLYKRLIDSGLAASFYTHAYELRDPGLFVIAATASHGTALTAVEQVINCEMQRLADEPVSDAELERIKSANRKGTTLARADILSFQQQLGEAEAVSDWRWLIDYDQHFEAVTAQEIMRVARTYLGKRNRTVGHFTPEKDDKSGENAGTAAPDTNDNRGSTSETDVVNASTSMLAARVTTTHLPNGLTVIVMQMPGAGSVSVSGKVRAGDFIAPPGKVSVAQLAADMLNKGSDNYSKDSIAEALETMGTDLSFTTGNFAVNFATTVVTADLPALLTMVADLLAHPLFTAEELKICKQIRTASIMSCQDNPAAVAANRLSQALYEEGNIYHPRDFAAAIAELETIEQADIVAFHSSAYTPQGTVLAVVGDIESATALALVADSFGSWSAPDSPLPEPGSCLTASQPAQKITVPMEGKASVSIAIGLPVSLKITAPDYLATQLANAALGGGALSSRLGLEVREKNGLTYGIYSYFYDVTSDGARWVISLETNPGNVEKALQLVNQVVTNYCANGITDSELADQQSSMVGEQVISNRNSASIAETLTYHAFFAIPLASFDNFESNIRAVTKEEVNEAIRKYFRIGEAVTVLAGTLVS